MLLNKKIFIALFLGILSISLVLIFENFTRDFFKKNSEILDKIYILQKEDSELNYRVLESSFFLYKNFDDIIKTQKNIENIFNTLNFEHIKKNHPSIYPALLEYKKSLDRKFRDINDFETLNSTIKNSTIYLSTLLSKIPNILDNKNIDKDYKELIIKTISSIFLAKNSFDIDFIENIKKNIERLKKFQFKNSDIKNFHTLLMAHLNLFIENFPLYINYMDNILKSDTENILNKIVEKFIKSTNKELKSITFLYAVLVMFYIGAIGYIIYLLILVDKENIKLKKTQKELKIMAKTDSLTGLLNRRELNIDKNRLNNPALMIVNIDNFKHYNDFYGINAGDFILKEVAKILTEIVPKKIKAKFYRIGGDDFGILFEKDHIDYKKVAKDIIDFFKNHKIRYQNIEIPLSVSIGITFQRPIIETADMALKYVKKDVRKSYFIYNKNLGFYEKIKDNLKKTEIFKNSLKNGLILPYFQPILDIKRDKIYKYEVLARVKNQDKIESIYPYLRVAKETKMYEDFTKMIIEKSFDYFKDKNIDFSVNLSMEDISNPNILKFLGKLFSKYPDISSKITFEILESEAISDYDSIREFISVVKSMGAKIAIDDFGSGYSNFEHILNLNIDYIKIDGSLIKDIDKNPHAKLITRMINNFAQEAKIKTVAEFVHSKKVFDIVKELDIDYAQGFYIGKPDPKIDQG